MYNPSSHFETYPVQANVKLLPFRFPAYKKKNIFYVVSTITILAFLLKKYRINLIYINTAGDFKYFLPLSRIMKIPVILHIHIDEPDDSLKWIKADCADRILFPSKATMTAILKHSPWIDSSRCFYVHNAVDLSEYFPHPTPQLKNELSINNNLPVIGIIGQLKKIKGQHLFLEMVKRLSEQNIKAYYIIVGDDNLQQGKYETFLKRKSFELGIQDKVMFLGYRKDIPEIMNLCDLIVVPSLREPFGRVVIEAMACGTPVVASAVGGIVEIFEDGYGGSFFPSGDVDVLIEKVLYFFNHPDWWKKQKTLALKRCKEEFNQKIHTHKVEEHITDVFYLYRSMMNVSKRA
ncbi:MAG: glycosyltransferase family 4 protein [Deltaproteobacteria bacterium]|nr:glycosyltransferase family 4 protein [Deltaproteobacteria bacterium]